eukprot:g7207.t1
MKTATAAVLNVAESGISTVTVTDATKWDTEDVALDLLEEDAHVVKLGETSSVESETVNLSTATSDVHDLRLAEESDEVCEKNDSMFGRQTKTSFMDRVEKAAYAEGRWRCYSLDDHDEDLGETTYHLGGGGGDAGPGPGETVEDRGKGSSTADLQMIFQQLQEEHQEIMPQCPQELPPHEPDVAQLDPPQHEPDVAQLDSTPYTGMDTDTMLQDVDSRAALLTAFVHDYLHSNLIWNAIQNLHAPEQVPAIKQVGCWCSRAEQGTPATTYEKLSHSHYKCGE